MIFTCLTCKRVKIGKYDMLRYSALNDEGVSTLYEGKLCKKCANIIEEVGLLIAETEKDEKN